jgi:alkylhydroperoxidase/carboxymuconolactone decarboxylase family protein YurZ
MRQTRTTASDGRGQAAGAGGAGGIEGFADLPAELQDLLRPKVERLGYLGEFFQRSAEQPEALAAFITWTETLKDALPFRITEAIALAVAVRTGNEYERVQHQRLALARGMTREEIVALERGRADGCLTLTDEETAAAALARCVLDDFGRGCESALLRLGRLIGEAAAVACLMLTARYLAHSTMVNAWGLQPPVVSPLETEQRDDG